MIKSAYVMISFFSGIFIFGCANDFIQAGKMIKSSNFSLSASFLFFMLFGRIFWYFGNILTSIMDVTLMCYVLDLDSSFSDHRMINFDPVTHEAFSQILSERKSLNNYQYDPI